MASRYFQIDMPTVDCASWCQRVAALLQPVLTWLAVTTCPKSGRKKWHRIKSVFCSNVVTKAD